MWWLSRIAWLPKKAINTVGSISAKLTTANTPAFAQSTGSRFGTATIVERIIPVEYSPLITSTPRTPIASWDTFTPDSATSSGLRLARSCGLRWLQRCARMVANSIGKPIPRTMATRNDQRVDRSERSFVHSETATRHWLRRPTRSRRGSAAAAVGAALTRLPPRRPCPA